MEDISPRGKIIFGRK